MVDFIEETEVWGWGQPWETLRRRKREKLDFHIVCVVGFIVLVEKCSCDMSRWLLIEFVLIIDMVTSTFKIKLKHAY